MAPKPTIDDVLTGMVSEVKAHHQGFSASKFPGNHFMVRASGFTGFIRGPVIMGAVTDRPNYVDMEINYATDALEGARVPELARQLGEYAQQQYGIHPVLRTYEEMKSQR